MHCSSKDDKTHFLLKTPPFPLLIVFSPIMKARQTFPDHKEFKCGSNSWYPYCITGTILCDIRWPLLFWLALSSTFGATRAYGKKTGDNIYADYSNYEIIERASPQAPTTYDGMPRVQPYSGISCYSCMSSVYGGLWEPVGYDRIYQRPGKGFAFTAHCNDPAQKPEEVDKIDCPTDNCVTLMETLKIGYGNVGYIRGCYSSVFKWGFNKTGISGRLQYKDFCHKFNLTDVAAGQNRHSLHNNEVYVCSCRGNLCNNGMGTTNSAASKLIKLAIVTAFSVILIVSWS